MFTRQKSGAACVFDSDGKRYKLLIRDDLAEAIRDFHGSGKLTDPDFGCDLPSGCGANKYLIFDIADR